MIKMSCSPDWMSSLPEELWDTPLTEFAIPGSHDAMSYCLDINSPLVPSESDCFRILDGLFYCFTRPTIFKWATTQDKSIEEQLSMGIRYFDLRVAHKLKDPSSDLYFTHVIYTHLTVLETLSSVALWLNSHPKEVVILACSHFQGISDKLHQSFIFSLKKMFGSKLCPYKVSAPTLRSLWAAGQQVILSYDSQHPLRHPELWPDIPYWWANQCTAKEVIKGFFVCGLNLTADRCFIAENLRQSLRTITFSNWECLRGWVEKQTPGSGPQSLNIIAGDFVGPLPLCSLIIALNQKLLRKKSYR
ncbi:hypothetical protein JOQ06_005709 [Pogonophryne albipinna]|uniref:Phosphatidylinositol-specific phospholipase C X domain-containing protein n=1 Tax=Pogonophryne albipinna TaxID=1090488 RepID=A0AAD6BI15_9TELE|nr:hypothetical protein JOQ06_005709 [Pogonophryne albipinna]